MCQLNINMLLFLDYLHLGGTCLGIRPTSGKGRHENLMFVPTKTDHPMLRSLGIPYYDHPKYLLQHLKCLRKTTTYLKGVFIHQPS